MYCPVTGDKSCACPKKNLDKTMIGSALMVDMKSALRKVFTDHAVYTSSLIIESLPISQPDAEAVTHRLLKNPQDIYDLLYRIVGIEKAIPVKEQFMQHLVLAAGLLTAVRVSDEQTVNKGVDDFYKQGNVLSEALHQLNPDKLRLGEVIKMIREHNEYVVNLATLRKGEQYEEYIETYDVYYKHMLMISDALYGAL